MSKPSKKAPAPPTPTPPATSRNKAIFAVVGIALAGVAIAAAVVMQRDSTPPQTVAQAIPAPAAAPTAAQPAADVQPAVVLGPHQQKDFPPLRLPGYALPRPAEVITAAYKFAADHPEILSYVPCFCGCERMGHHGNEDCFVQKRGANGDVTEWTEHGMECTVCIDVATRSMRMFNAGAAVTDIRAAVEKEWSAHATTHTPTPSPPAHSH